MTEYWFILNKDDVTTRVTVPDDVVNRIRYDAAVEYHNEFHTEASNDLFYEIVTTMVADIAGKDFKNEPELKDFEQYDIVDNFFCDQVEGHFVDDLVSGKMRSCLRDIMDEFYKNRVKYFRFTVEYSGSFSVWVRAANEDDARDCLDSVRDLTDYSDVDISDSLFTVSIDADEEQTTVPVGYDYIDATEG